MCFDKTGTITEDGMRFKSVRACAIGNGSKRFEDGEWTSAELRRAPVTQLAKAMATCHSLVELEVGCYSSGDGFGGHGGDDHDCDNGC
jgi:magnesium-transporting ATPase (P-type)